MPLYQALLGLAVVAFAHSGHKAPEGHLHIFAQPSGNGAPQQVEMGACVGEKPGPKVDLNAPPPFDLKKGTVTAEDQPIFKYLGYTLDEKLGVVKSPKGAVVMDAEMKHLLAPFDASQEKLAAFIWMGLHTQNNRLDENTCHIVDEKGKAARYVDITLFGFWVEKQTELMAVQGIHADLAKLDPSQPVPAALLERIAQMKSAQLHLPDGLEQALAGAATVKDAMASVDKLHADSLKFWDGLISPQDRNNAALPALPGRTVPAEPGAAYFSDAEARLGKVLAADVEKLFGQYGPGKEMLERYRNAKGEIELPRMTIWKISQRPDDPGYGASGAIYNSQANAVVFNHWSIARSALMAAPEKEREQLAKDFADSRKLAAYLETHPEAREKFLESVDVMLYHELTHGWQAKRGKVGVETMRGNLPAANPVEDEHEAYREENRYFHAKLLKDPAKAVKDPWINQYFPMLSDFNQFEAGITRTYMSNFGATSDYPTIAVMQDNRRGIFDRILDAKDNVLKKLGLDYGDEALKESEAESAKRRKEFLEKEWDQMRKEGYGALLGEYRRVGRPDKALIVAAQSGGAVDKKEREALKAETFKQLGDKKLSAWDKSERWDALEAAGVKLTPELDKRRGADYDQLIRDYIKAAKNAKTPRERRAMIDAARNYLNKAGSKDKLKKELDDAEALK